MSNDKKSKSAITTMKNFEFYLLFAVVGGMMALVGANVGFSYSHGFSTTELLPFPVERKVVEKEVVREPFPILFALPVPSPVPAESFVLEDLGKYLDPVKTLEESRENLMMVAATCGSTMYEVEKELSSCKTAAAGTYFARARALAKCEESICSINGWVKGRDYIEPEEYGI